MKQIPTTSITILLLASIVFSLLFPVSVSGQTNNSRPPEVKSDGPKYEQYFNCRCDDECGFALKDCTCPFSEKMRARLKSMDQKGYSLDKQIKRMKERYGGLVLAVPEQKGSDLILYYFVPPTIIFLGLLFVGGFGWYWRFG